MIKHAERKIPGGAEVERDEDGLTISTSRAATKSKWTCTMRQHRQAVYPTRDGKQTKDETPGGHIASSRETVSSSGTAGSARNRE
jgi:hypothetical protein